MTASNIRDLSLPLPPAHWTRRLARRRVFTGLESLRHGTLIIEDDNGVQHFGQAPGSSTLTARIQVLDTVFYGDMVAGGSVGAAESYVRGCWRSPDLVKVIRVIAANLAVIQAFDSGVSVWQRLLRGGFRLAHRNSLKGSKRNISAHYDLGNDFFALFLDRSMMYSSAVFPHRGTSLEEASTYKLDQVCEKLELGPDDHLLEIGTGWGGMAIHAARQYGCRVTTTTISREQYEYARERVKAEGLEDSITLLLQDYRQLEGQFDKLVSIEMIEAVGHRYHETYFRQCSRLLRDDGLMFIQAIMMPDQRYERARRHTDFIQRYIFPGGCLPSATTISQCLGRNTDMQIVDVEDITAHYARTLACWRERFETAIDQVSAQGFEEQFQRLWRYYLCYCEAGFSERVIGTSQFLFAKPHYRAQLRDAPRSEAVNGDD